MRKFTSYRHNKFVKIGAVSSRISTVLAKKYGAVDWRILRDWDSLMGKELSRLTRPLSIRWGKTGGSIRIETSSAYASELQMRTAEILARLNGYYGYEAIRRVDIKHMSVFSQPKISEETKSVNSNQPSVEPPININGDRICEIGNTELRNSLEELITAYKNKGKGDA